MMAARAWSLWKRSGWRENRQAHYNGRARAPTRPSPACRRLPGHHQKLLCRPPGLAGVEAADVYLLLLGEHYGEPLPDTGKAPTEEEFTVAKRRGIPILVFRKTGIDPDDRQREFIARVGDYQQGRFWKEFGDNGRLAIVVLEALREVAAEAAPLRSWVTPAGRPRLPGTLITRRALSALPAMPSGSPARLP